MNLTKITAVALAMFVVGAGAVAAVPGQAADQAQGHANDDASDAGAAANGGTAGDAGTNASDDAPERRGPPVDVPGQVPEHVSQIHQAIVDWLDGDRAGSLGDRISDIVGGDDAADQQSEE